MKQGQGTYRWADGSRYEGQFDNDIIQGKGVYHALKSVYEGQFHASMQHGVGKQNWQDGGTVFCSTAHVVVAVALLKFVVVSAGNANTSPINKFSFPGRTYEGQYFENHRHGTGRMKW